MYKVKSLCIGGRNNKKYRSGDVVTDKMFPAGNAELLLAQGHIVFEDDEKQKEFEANKGKKPVKPVQIARDVNQEEDDAKAKSNSASNTSDEDDEKKKAFDDISKEEIIEYLVKKDVTFNPELGKNKLYKLYEKN